MRPASRPPWDRGRPARLEMPMKRAELNGKRGFPSRTANEETMRERDANEWPMKRAELNGERGFPSRTANEETMRERDSGLGRHS